MNTTSIPKDAVYRIICYYHFDGKDSGVRRKYLYDSYTQFRNNLTRKLKDTWMNSYDVHYFWNNEWIHIGYQKGT